MIQVQVATISKLLHQSLIQIELVTKLEKFQIYFWTNSKSSS
jgi:hypothetical protein